MTKLKHNGIRRFARYFLSGFSTFLLDLGLLYILVQHAHVEYLVAVPVAFLFASSIQFFIVRKFVFTHSNTSKRRSYTQYVAMAVTGVVATTWLTHIFVVMGANILAARIVVSGIVGIGNYTFNLFFNFKVSGKEL